MKKRNKNDKQSSQEDGAKLIRDKVINVRFDKETYDEVTDYAADLGMDKSSFVRLAVEDYLDERDKEELQDAISDYISGKITGDEYCNISCEKIIPSELVELRKDFLSNKLFRQKNKGGIE